MQQLLMQTWSKCTVFNFQLYDGKATQLCKSPEKKEWQNMKKKNAKKFHDSKKMQINTKMQKKGNYAKNCKFSGYCKYAKKMQIIVQLEFFP